MKSKVKWFNNRKGYGFITLNEGEDVFVHYSAIEQNGFKTLKEDDEVEFELVNTGKGYQAINVKRTAEVKEEIYS